MKLGANGGFTKISKSLGSIGEEKSYDKCPSCKDNVWFLLSSPKLISQLKGAPSRNNVPSRGLIGGRGVGSWEGGQPNFAGGGGG